MRGHIADDQWIDVLEGVADPQVRRHIEGCGSCREKADGVRGGWALAHEADVPEPSPLYWESFRRRVGQAIEQEAVPPARWSLTAWRWPLAAAASAVLAFSVYLAPSSGTRRVGSLSDSDKITLAAWSALPPAEEDDALPVLAAAIEDDAPAPACSDLASCLADLSEDESAGFADALRTELSGRVL
jgi:hypothetical protein